MTEQWHMDPRIKTQIEKVVKEELIDGRGATQAEIKSFFADWRLRNRVITSFDEMRESKKTPVLQCMEEAQTD